MIKNKKGGYIIEDLIMQQNLKMNYQNQIETEIIKRKQALEKIAVKIKNLEEKRDRTKREIIILEKTLK